MLDKMCIHHQWRNQLNLQTRWSLKWTIWWLRGSSGFSGHNQDFLNFQIHSENVDEQVGEEAGAGDVEAHTDEHIDVEGMQDSDPTTMTPKGIAIMDEIYGT